MSSDDALALACVLNRQNKAQSVESCLKVAGHTQEHERLWLARYDRLISIGYIVKQTWELTSKGKDFLRSTTNSLETTLYFCKKAITEL